MSAPLVISSMRCTRFTSFSFASPSSFSAPFTISMRHLRSAMLMHTQQLLMLLACGCGSDCGCGCWALGVKQASTSWQSASMLAASMLMTSLMQLLMLVLRLVAIWLYSFRNKGSTSSSLSLTMLFSILPTISAFPCRCWERRLASTTAGSTLMAETIQKLMMQSATTAMAYCCVNCLSRYLQSILQLMRMTGGMEQSILKRSLKKISRMFLTACTSQCNSPSSLDSDLCSILPSSSPASTSSLQPRLEKQGKAISSQMPSSCRSSLLMQLRYLRLTGARLRFFSSQRRRPLLQWVTLEGRSSISLLLLGPSRYLLLSWRSSLMLALGSGRSSSWAGLNSSAWSILAISSRQFLMTRLAYCRVSLRSISSARITCANPRSSRLTSLGCCLPSTSGLTQKATILSRSLWQTSSSTMFSNMELTMTLAREAMASGGSEDWYLRMRSVMRQGSLERESTTSLTKVQASPNPSSASSRFSSSSLIAFSPFSLLSLPKLLNGFSFLLFSCVGEVWVSISPRWTVFLQQEKRAFCIFFWKAIFCSLSVVSRKNSSLRVACSCASRWNSCSSRKAQDSASISWMGEWCDECMSQKYQASYWLGYSLTASLRMVLRWELEWLLLRYSLRRSSRPSSHSRSSFSSITSRWCFSLRQLSLSDTNCIRSATNPNSSFFALKLNTWQSTSSLAMSSTSMVRAAGRGSVVRRRVPAAVGKTNSRQTNWLRARFTSRCSSFAAPPLPASCAITIADTPFTTSMLWISSFTMHASASAAPLTSSRILRSSSAILALRGDAGSEYCVRYCCILVCSWAMRWVSTEMSLVSSVSWGCSGCSGCLQVRRRRWRQACCSKRGRKQVKWGSLAVEKAGLTLFSSRRSRDSLVWISSLWKKLSQQAPIAQDNKCHQRRGQEGMLGRVAGSVGWLQFKSMSEAQVSRNGRIKSFEQKVVNRSFTDLLFYDRLADYLLECCNSEAKPNTLSLFSCLPLLLLACLVHGPSTPAFLLTVLAILLHQLFDIANKKQAYRLSCFSLATYYIDHIFDALSAVLLVVTVGALLELEASSVLTAVFFFAILPFYTHHLAMYNNEYFTFDRFSPSTEGLAITKLLFLIAAINPALFRLELIQGVTLCQLYIGLAAVWLGIFVVLDLKTVMGGKRVTDLKASAEQEYPLKNIFCVFMVGYATMEMTSIEPELLDESLYFYFSLGLVSLIFAHMISNLLLSYAYNEKYKQITLPFLLGIGVVLVYYFSCAFVLEGEEVEMVVSKVVLGVAFFAFLLYFVRDTWKNVAYINSVHSA